MYFKLILKQAKKELKMKIIYKSRIKNISNNETEIRNLLKNYNKQTAPKDMIDTELNQQESNFKTRLNERRRTNFDKTDLENIKNNYMSQNDQHRIEFN